MPTGLARAQEAQRLTTLGHGSGAAGSQDVIDVSEAHFHLKGRVASDVVAQAFFFPYALGFIDMMHVCYNAFESSASEHQHWKEIQRSLTAIVGFLSDDGLRGRFFALSVPDAASRLLLNNWSIHHGFSWKWQYMSALTKALVPVHDCVKAHFNISLFRGDKTWSNLHSQLIEDFEWAMQHEYPSHSIIVGSSQGC